MENVGKEYGELSVFRESINSESGAATIGIHRAPDTGKIQMAFGHIMRLVDLETNQVLPEVNGVAIIRVNMNETIYPLIRAWPGMRETGETLITRREGEHTLFLNPLRFGTNPPLTLRVPRDSEIAQPAHLASEGDEGIVQSVDYRGVRVLAGLPIHSRHRLGLRGQGGFVSGVLSDPKADAAVASDNGGRLLHRRFRGSSLRRTAHRLPTPPRICG